MWCCCTLAASAFAQPSNAALFEASSNVGSWQGFANTTWRSSTNESPLPSLASPSWLRTFDNAGTRIRWISQVSPVVTRSLVIAPGIVSPSGGPANQLRLFALHRSTGAIAWSTPLAITPSALSLESQSVPAIDARAQSVIYPHGSTLTCLSVLDGSVLWQRPLGRLVVNASPVIASDAPHARRVFITTFDAAAGNAGELVCINLSPFDAVRNTFAPGDIVWRVAIGGSSGNTPAFVPASLGGAGLVYVTSAGAYGQSPAVPGSILAFDAHAALAPTPTWQTLNTNTEGFYGGLSIDLGGRAWSSENAGQSQTCRPTIAAASYAFSGGLQSANVLLIDAGTGAARACSTSNRTSSTPVWLPTGNILLSTGLDSASVSDTAPALELFAQPSQWTLACSSQPLLWNSALSTWNDTNFNGVLNPGEYASFGHYTHQPAISTFAGFARVCVGTAPSGDRVSPPTMLRVIDPAHVPSSAAFIVATASVQVGGSPALAGLNLYSSGADGLAAFGVSPTSLDVDASGVLLLDDVHSWEAGLGARDIDASGTVSQADRDTLLHALRSRERFSLLHMGVTRVGGVP
jgi:outer membrane protein assembly factor BamB